MGQTIQLVREHTSVIDAHGNPVYTTNTTTLNNVLVAFGNTGEPTDANRSPLDSDLTLYLPAGLEILDGDQFIVNGEHYVKDGIAQNWQSVTNTPAGVVVNVRRRDG